jgi:hypothetical protein
MHYALCTMHSGAICGRWVMAGCGLNPDQNRQERDLVCSATNLFGIDHTRSAIHAGTFWLLPHSPHGPGPPVPVACLLTRPVCIPDSTRRGHQGPPGTRHQGPPGTRHQAPPGTRHKAPGTTRHQGPPGTRDHQAPGTTRHQAPGAGPCTRPGLGPDEISVRANEASLTPHYTTPHRTELHCTALHSILLVTGHSNRQLIYNAVL